MAAKTTALGTALAFILFGLAAGLGSPTHAQSMVATSSTAKPVANARPTISGNPSRMLVAGSFYDFRPAASDPDSAKLTFSINKKPAWANFDASTGRLYGTPSAIDVGKIKGIQISVSDGEKRANLTRFGIKVIAGQPPRIAGTPATTATEGQPYQFQPSASDNDQQKLQFAVTHKPSWASFDAFSGRLYGTPPAGSAGTYASIVVSVTDGATTVSLPAFAIEVASGPAIAPANSAPVITGVPPSSIQVGQTYSFVPSATDSDGDSLSFSTVNLPGWLSLDKASGRITGKPQSGHEGNYTEIVLSVTDGEAISFLTPFSIVVTASPPAKTPVPNVAPVISGTPVTSVAEGGSYAFQPAASDADGDALAFSGTNVPAWLSVSSATGRLSGLAPAGSAGTYSGIYISVSDGVSTVSLPAFTLTVLPPPANVSPTILGTPLAKATVGQPYSFLPVASDPDGDALSFSVSGKPAWLTFDIKSGRLSGTPTTAQIGASSNIRVSVTDGKAWSSLPTFTVTVVAVNASNLPPSIGGSPALQATEGTAYAFQPIASDPNGDVLQFSATGVPGWLVFNPVTGALSGTPPVGSVGTYGPIVLTVSDGASSVSLPAFSIAVVAKPNGAPTISGTPAANATVGQAYAFQPVATDPDGQVLAFGIANKPSWASFNTATGKLTGTPQADNTGTFANIVISVSDGTYSATLPAFSITVAAVPPANVAPTISGTPVTTATVGQPYSFQPTASDPDGPALAFGIANKPSWASFNVATGLLSGTPQSAGTYASIVISVSDGSKSATLPPFTITAVAPSTPGLAELTWTAPTANEDGSALTNLAGYRIRYGTAADSLTQTVTIGNPAVTTASIENLSPGTWYFSISAYTNTGVESAPTGPVYKSVL